MNKLKNTLHYSWLYYVLVVLLAVALWLVSFNLFHAPKEFESLDIFFAGSIKDYQIEQEAQNALAEHGVKAVEFYSSNPADNTFATKYNVVGLNNCDVCIVPLSIAENTQCNLTFLELTDLYGCSPFVQEGKTYGILLPSEAKTALEQYFTFTNEEYVLLINESTVNSGSASSLNKNAQIFVNWLVTYVQK